MKEAILLGKTMEIKRRIVIMSEVWNKVYKSDNSFFGEEPSNFAQLCFNHMKTNNAKRVLELGA
ncbi:MAG: hypothetical protein M3P08_17800, partial [Thermoproteota archaeon]|nr:hypothetical protein [Thermoproteota archaeon]